MSAFRRPSPMNAPAPQLPVAKVAGGLLPTTCTAAHSLRQCCSELPTAGSIYAQYGRQDREAGSSEREAERERQRDRQRERERETEREREAERGREAEAETETETEIETETAETETCFARRSSRGRSNGAPAFISVRVRPPYLRRAALVHTAETEREAERGGERRRERRRQTERRRKTERERDGDRQGDRERGTHFSLKVRSGLVSDASKSRTDPRTTLSRSTSTCSGQD